MLLTSLSLLITTGTSS